MTTGAKSLKTQNLLLLVGALVADAAIVAVIAGLIGADWFSAANLKRASSAAIVPVIALLLTNLFPQSWRDRIAHMRFTHALPGHRAFSIYGPADWRVDMAAIEKKCGALPTVPGEQNKLWYRLFKEVDHEPSVVQSHGRYLLFRDLAAMSLVLFIASPLLSFAFDWRIVGFAALLLGVQTVLCAVTSRNTGVRFVTNVLALHGATITKPKSKAKTKSPA
jgi:hypothetical protein